LLRQEKYQDLLGYEKQVETIHKDFAEIDTIHKIHFIEVNNVELKQKLMNEATEIRGNIKDLIRNKFKSHIEGIVDLLMSIINEFKEGIEYPNLQKFKDRRVRLEELRNQKNDFNEL
jgi:hypothetical protein